MQSVHTDTKGNAGLFRGVAQGIVAMVRSEGVLSLWRGLTPTLWRDVPFSGRVFSPLWCCVTAISLHSCSKKADQTLF